MKITGFKAKGFRNIDECDIAFSDGVNLLIGNNAEGKTNCLEGIYLFSRGKSFRQSEDKNLIKNGEEGFYLSLDYEDRTGKGRLEYSLLGRTRQRKKNGYKIARLTDMIGSFRSVLFEPDNLGLVKEGPEARRSFLNVALSQCYPDYINLYSSFKVALENRNAILKKASEGIYYDGDELVEWSRSLADYSSYIYEKRYQYIKLLNERAREKMLDFSRGRENLTLTYKGRVEYSADREKIKEQYLELLTSNIEKEIRAGVTLYGPHRDDIEILINEKEARLFASQGQQRTIVLSMKLAEGEVLEKIFGEEPVYLFDDVLSELDKERRKFLIKGMNKKQIIITSCESEELIGLANKVIRVEGGRFTDVSAHR